MKSTIQFFILLIMAISFVGCEVGYVSEEPLYVEPLRPIAPYPNYIWIGGEWQYRRGTHNYQQTPGHWSAPRRGRNYQPGYWNHDNRGHHWNGGRWK